MSSIDNFSGALILDRIVSREDLNILASEISKLLLTQSPFCLWLEGPLGAGKTTLVGLLLKHMGLSERQPVNSPTYTYVNEYEIDNKLFAHLDLYRLKGQHFDESDILTHPTYRGLFIEWPQIHSHSQFLVPTHKISIQAPEENHLLRRYALSSTLKTI